jgi:hypothetical protein
MIGRDPKDPGRFVHGSTLRTIRYRRFSLTWSCNPIWPRALRVSRLVKAIGEPTRCSGLGECSFNRGRCRPGQFVGEVAYLLPELRLAFLVGVFSQRTVSERADRAIVHRPPVARRFDHVLRHVPFSIRPDDVDGIPPRSGRSLLYGVTRFPGRRLVALGITRSPAAQCAGVRSGVGAPTNTAHRRRTLGRSSQLAIFDHSPRRNSPAGIHRRARRGI